MSIKIDHLRYKVTTKPNSKQTEFVLLNLVFSVSKDDDCRDWFDMAVEDYVPEMVILDVELFERELDICFAPIFNSESDSELLDTEDETVTSQISFDSMATENTVTGFVYQNNILKYIPKFDKFHFHAYFSWCGLTQGAINDLRLLQSGYNPTRTTDSCFLFNILKALERHWD